MTKVLYVRNWDKWQSYRKDRGTPPWIKVYRNLFSNEEWAGLSDSEKGQLISIWILAADKKGIIPADPVVIKKMCLLDSVPNINKFIGLNILSTTCQPLVNHLSTTCQQSDAPETETETETETEAEQQKSTPTGGFQIPDQDKLQNGSDKLIIQTIDDLCQELYVKKIFKNVHAFKNKLLKQKMNPRAILHTLTRCYHKGISSEGFEGSTPWGYCIKIMSVENGNYNESDHNRTSF